jgi:heme-degrading monooxygenase HmoA
MSSNTSQHVYRVDKFRVPAAARAEFLERVRATHASLKSLPGFVEDSILEQTGGPGAFNYVTVVIWRDAEALNQARAAMEEERRSTGFDPKELFSRLNIEADMANYAKIAL